MTGVFFRLASTGCTFVSTDGHRLVKYNRTDIKGDDLNHMMILPKKSMILIRASLLNQKAQAVSAANQGKAQATQAISQQEEQLVTLNIEFFLNIWQAFESLKKNRGCSGRKQ